MNSVPTAAQQTEHAQTAKQGSRWLWDRHDNIVKTQTIAATNKESGVS